MKVKPPVPKRVSSAKGVTSNRAKVEDATGDQIFNQKSNDPQGSISIDSNTVMGSGSSINHQNCPVNESYVQSKGDLSSPSHATPRKQNEFRDCFQDTINSFNDEASSSTLLDEEFTMVHNPPITSLHFKQSTFKGASMSAFTLSRHSFEKNSRPILSSLLPQKGKYKFSNAESTFNQDAPMESNDIKPLTMRFGSAKLHQSSSEDLHNSATSLDSSSEKTAMTYGTFRKENTSGSVTEIFQKSKSKIRSSLRNWKLYTRNSNHADKANSDSSGKPASPELFSQPSKLYDPTLTKPEDLDSFDWLSKSHDSACLTKLKQAHTKAALPVQIPTLDRRSIEKKRDVIPSMQNPKLKMKDVDFAAISQTINPNSISKTPEQESIDILDSVIKNHSSSYYSKSDGAISSSDDCISQNILGSKIGKPTRYAEVSRAREFGRRGIENLQAPRNSWSDDHEISIIPRQVLPHHKSPVARCGPSVSEVLEEGINPQNGYGLDESISLSVSSQNWEDETDSFEENSSSFTESADILGETDDLTGRIACCDTIRKTGWLVVKQFLVSKQGKLEKPGRRKWRRFWVNLKGGQLIFYEITEKTTTEESVHPALIISVDGALIQALPEHATKNNVMCLSTAPGSVYFLQAISQIDLINWIQTVHVEAATIFAKQKKENSQDATRRSLRLILQKAIDVMKHDIDEDEKMRKMAQLQNTLVPDAKSQRAIADQIAKWEENAEKNHIDVFRLRCYQSSLETTELPNPQSAIAAARKSSKHALSGLKLLNAATLHALVMSKQTNIASPRKRSFALNLNRFGGYSENTDSGAQRNHETVKPKKSTIFGSLRGFDTWKGSSSGGGKKRQRTSVGGIISAFTPSSSSQSSSSKDERFKSLTSSDRNDVTILAPANEDYTSSAMHLPDTQSDDEILDGFESVGGSLDSLLLTPPDAWCMPVEYDSSSVRVSVSRTEYVTVTTTENMTCRQLLEIVCQRKQLDSSNYFLAIGDEASFVEYGSPVSDVSTEKVAIKMKKQYCVELNVADKTRGFDVHRPKMMCCPLVISFVRQESLADNIGMHVGEELIVMNGELTCDMSDAEVDEALDADFFRLLIQTCIYDKNCEAKTWWPGDSKKQGVHDCEEFNTPASAEERRIRHLMTALEDYLKNIIVRPPPITSVLQPPFIRSPFLTPYFKTNLGKRHDSIEDIVSLLVVPRPDAHHSETDDKGAQRTLEVQPPISNSECDKLIDTLLQRAETVTRWCEQLSTSNTSSLSCNQFEGDSGTNTHQNPLSEQQKLWKVLDELVYTENNYVKDLNHLLKRFLEPLYYEGFLERLEMEPIFHSVVAILNFQKNFLADLVKPLPKERDLGDVSDLNQCLVSVAMAFLKHAAQFKLYAVFSTCHAVAQTLIQQTKAPSSDVRAFLEARNPKQQHSLSLDSYLIKPIQRVLKYPLLLREILSLSESLESIDSKAKKRISASLHAMHSVARHINDAQTAHDEFGAEGFREVVEQAALNVFGSNEIISSLDMTNLLCYCQTEWQNAPEEVSSRVKKGSIPEMLVLVFRSAILLLCRITKQRDKKRIGTPQSELLPPYTRCTAADVLYTDIIRGNQLSVTGKYQGDKNALELLNEVESCPTAYSLLCNSLESNQRLIKTCRYVIRETRSHKENDSDEDVDTAKELSDITLPKMSGAESKESDLDMKSVGDSMNSSEPVAETPTGNKGQKLFYRPEREGRQSSHSNSDIIQDIIPMTIPLPTYETAENERQVSSEEPRDCSSATLRSTRSRSKAGHRRSGLYISMVPLSHNVTDNGVRFRKPGKNQEISQSKFEITRSSLDDCKLDGDKSPEKLNCTDSTRVPDEKFPKASAHPEKSQDSEQKSHHNEAVNKYSQHNFPSRYNMVYGVAPYESKL